MTSPASRIRVLAVDLARDHAAFADLERRHGLLSEDERRRAGAIAAALVAGPQRAAHWTAARVALRSALIAAGEPRARGTAFAVGPHGKPSWDGGGPSFSLSHSGGAALIAIADVPVGVDVEGCARRAWPQPRMRLIAAAGAALDDTVEQRWASERSEERAIAGWTLLEAVAKATGDGVGAVLAAAGIWGSAGRVTTAEAAAQRIRAYAAGHRLVARLLPAAATPASMVAAVAAHAGRFGEPPAVEPWTPDDAARALTG